MKINTPPSIASLRGPLREFLDIMVFKLHQNSHKETPSHNDVPTIIAGVRREIAEFEEQFATDKNDFNSLVELADAANMAFLAFVALRKDGVKDARELFIDEYLRVDTLNGKVYIKKGRAGSRYKIGEEVRGGVVNSGYVHIRCQSKTGTTGISMPRSHVVWYAHTGKWPTGVLDHINRNRQDDRVSNLRDVSCSENNLNRGRIGKLPPFVTSYKPSGRTHLKHYGKFVYQRRFKGLSYRYGYWDTPEEAAECGLERFKNDVGYSPTLDM